MVERESPRQFANKILKIISMCLLVFLLSVIAVNLLRPLFYKTVDVAYLEQLSGTDFTSDTSCTERIRCIDDNEEALLWRLRMISQAEETIVLATFDLRADNSGTDVMAALYEAAERGVQVKLLVDGIYQLPFLKGNDTFEALICHENIEARFYNPVTFANIYDVNYRMHDKYVMIDDRMYLLGGRNTNDIFLGNYKAGINADRDILVYSPEVGAGESLKALQSYFQTVWEEPCSRKETPQVSEKTLNEQYMMFRERYAALTEVYGDFKEYDSWVNDTYEANKITLVTNETHDGNKEPRVLYAIRELALKGRDVLIQTPYIICNREMYEVLEEISENAQLQVMINAVEKGSNPWGCTDYLNNKKKVLAIGTTVYEVMNEHAVHTKTILIDDNISIVGSYNLDMRSTYLDTEMMLVIDSEQLNAHLREMAAEYMAKSNQVLPDGTEEQGILYQTRKLTTGKKIFYGVLRVAIRAFRHLL